MEFSMGEKLYFYISLSVQYLQAGHFNKKSVKIEHLYLLDAKPELTITKHFVWIVSTVVLPIAPDAVPHTAAIHAPSVALLTHTVGWNQTGDDALKLRTTTRENKADSVLTERGAARTTIRLFLVRLVLAVGHAVTRQGVVDTVSVSTLKLINVVACSVESCETETGKCT